MGRILVAPGSRSELPTAPPEVAQELELYARENGGRTARFHFVPFGGWMARFSLRGGDKRLLLSQEDRVAEAPTEDVWFHVKNPYEHEVCDIRSKPEWHDYPLLQVMCEGMKKQGTWLPLAIHRMGAGGVRKFLEMGNTWSGRGQHASVEAAVKHALEQDEKNRVAFREQQKVGNRLEMREKRRSVLKIPFLNVGIDLSKRA